MRGRWLGRLAPAALLGRVARLWSRWRGRQAPDGAASAPRASAEALEPRLLHAADLPTLGAALPDDPVAERRLWLPEPATVAEPARPSVAQPREEWVFVDSRLQDLLPLHEALSRRQAAGEVNLRWVTVHADGDGLGQVAQALSGHSGVAAVHVFSHAQPGALLLGDGPVDLAALLRSAGALHAWAAALAPGADVMLYGCDLADGPAGEAWVASFARFTGADVAASTDATGAAAAGGDWLLERTHGNVTTAVAVDDTAAARWQGLLAVQPVGPERRASTSATVNVQATTGFGGGSVAMDGSGRSVVVYGDASSNAGDVFFQRFDADGNLLGSPTRVNGFTANLQHEPAVATNAGGAFAVVWSSNLQDGSANGVYLQRYDAGGNPSGTATRVNTRVTGDQSIAKVAMAGDGSLVVAFTDFGLGDVYAQRYDAAGAAVGGNWRVNSVTANSQGYPDVAMAPDGRFVITWESTAQDGSLTGVYGQRYAADGTPQGGEFQVHQTTAGLQESSKVVMAPDGSFVVAWESQQGATIDFLWRRFAPDGTPLTAEIVANSTVAGTQRWGDIALRDDGTVVAVWESDTADGSGLAVVAQHFAADGRRLGGEQVLNVTTSGDQDSPSLAVSGPHAVAVWRGNGSGDSSGVFLRTLSFAGIDVTAPSWLETAEAGGTASVSVVLRAAPAADVTLPVTVSDTTAAVLLTPATLTFTPLNWNVPQTVTVAGVDDALADGWQRYALQLGPAVSADPDYQGIDPADVPGATADNEFTAGQVTVDTTSDVLDGDTGSLGALAARPGADGRISLREALTAANQTPNAGGPDQVRFAIPGTGVHVITPLTALPSITDAVDLDARTDDSHAAQGNRPAIVLDGEGLVATGLVLAAGSGGSRVQGLLIRDFDGDGVSIGSGVSGVLVAGNAVGRLNTDGSDAGDGEDLTGAAIRVAGSQHRIGGTGAGDGNQIAGGTAAVRVVEGSGHAVLGNRFDRSGPQPIDLGPAGVTANDAGDVDSGPNDLQNHPVLTSATLDGGQLRVTGSLASAPGTTYRIELYRVPAGQAGPSGHGGAAQVVQVLTVVTDGTGMVRFDTGPLPAGGVGVGDSLTATATPETGPGSYGGTSEMAANVTVTAPVVPTPPTLDLSGPTALTAVGSEQRVDPPSGSGAALAASGRAVGSDASGRSVVVWSVRGVDAGSTVGVMAQRLDAGGQALGPAFQVNTTVAGHQTEPAVAVQANGAFVVVWQGAGPGDGGGIFGQRFDANGQRLGGEFRISTTDNPREEIRPVVAVNDSGAFVVAWQDSFWDNVYLQRFDAAGQRVGGEIAVAPDVGSPFSPRVAVGLDAAGVATVVFGSFTTVGDSESVLLRRYAANGQPLGGLQQVNQHTDFAQADPSIAVHPDGRFAVAWTSQWQDSDGLWGVYARLYDATGSPLGAEFGLAALESGDQIHTTLATMPDGGYLGAWVSDDGTSRRIQAQLLGATGQRVGPELTVAAATSGTLAYPSVAVSPAGEARIVWSSDSPSGSGGVRLQRLSGSASADHAAVFTENGPAVAVAAASATVGATAPLVELRASLLQRPDGALERLTADTQGTALTAQWDAPTGVLRITGADSAAAFQQVLRSLRYDNTAPEPDPADRTVEVQATDAATASAVARSTLRITLVDDAPLHEITVTTLSDAPQARDGDTRSLRHLLLNPGSDGRISLREALLAANATPNDGATPDRIRFALDGAPTGGEHRIELASVLPDITDGVVLDGTSEPDHAGTPVVVIDGNGMAAGGLRITAGQGTRIEGLALVGFGGNGITVTGGAQGTVIRGNHIGTGAAGLAAESVGGWSIDVIGAGGGTRIGGSAAGDGNVIGIGGQGGIAINASPDTAVLGNRIGVGADGLRALGGTGPGVLLLNDTAGSRVGGAADADGNRIANAGTGIALATANSRATLLGNRLTDLQGQAIDQGWNGLPEAADPLDADGGPNDGQNAPVLTAALLDNGQLSWTGQLSSEPGARYRIELFAAPTAPQGRAEAAVRLTAFAVTTDAQGQADVGGLGLPVNLAVGHWLTASATRELAPGVWGVTSELAAPVAVTAPPNRPATGVLRITGTPQEDQVLQADAGALADADGLGPLVWQWTRNGVPIPGATTDRLTLGDAEVGARIAVQATMVDGRGGTETWQSAETAAVANVNDVPQGLPRVLGLAQQGQTLTLDVTGISDADGLGILRVQWQRDGQPIAGATGLQYRLEEADVGRLVGVRVAFTDGFGTLETLESAAAGPVANRNDPPVFQPADPLAPLVLDRAENAPGVLTLVAADPDDSPASLRFAIAGGDDAAQFRLDPVSGALAFATPPDHEAPTDRGADNVYELVVSVSDPSGATALQSWRLRVTDVNEAPLLQALAEVILRQDVAAGAVLAEARASDPDAGDRLRFSLDDDAGGRFAIDAGTGVVQLLEAGRADIARGGQWDLQVRVTDAGGLTHATVLRVIALAAPAPGPDPAPLPPPTPAPAPEPPPAPAPTPAPAPSPLPMPSPAPSPVPMPSPAPSPVPSPAPTPVPAPAPAPGAATPVGPPAAAPEPASGLPVAPGPGALAPPPRAPAPSDENVTPGGPTTADGGTPRELPVPLADREPGAAALGTPRGVASALGRLTALLDLPGVSESASATASPRALETGPSQARPRLETVDPVVSAAPEGPVSFDLTQQLLASLLDGSDPFGDAAADGLAGLQAWLGRGWSAAGRADNADTDRTAAGAGGDDDAGSERSPIERLALELTQPERVMGVSLTAGLVWWVTRGGGVLASALMGVPAWRQVDLLPVLDAAPDDEGDDDAEPPDGAAFAPPAAGLVPAAAAIADPRGGVDTRSAAAVDRADDEVDALFEASAGDTARLARRTPAPHA